MAIRLQLGDSEALGAFVLVHCAPGDASIFARLAPALAEHGRVILVDLPDAGTSPDLSTDPNDAVADVSAIISKLGPAPVTAVGLSFGAWVCARLACAGAPANLARLVLLGGFAGLGPDHAALYRTLADDLDAGRMELSALWEGLITGCFPTGTTAENRALVDAMVAAVSRDRAVRTLRRNVALANADARIGPYNIPAVVVHARNDAVIPLQLAEELAARGEKARLQILDADTHLIALTHVDECVAAILS